MKSHRASTAHVAPFALGLFCASLACNSSPEAKSARDLAIRVADDVCNEVQDAGVADPEMMSIICKVTDALETVKVLLPRKEWHAIRARSSRVDAGPGK